MRSRWLSFTAVSVLLACASQAHAQEPTSQPASHPKRNPLAARLALGATATRLHRFNFSGPSVLAAFGGETPALHASAELEYTRAQTENGLVANDARVGGTVLAILGPLRLGGGPSVSWFALQRKSQEGGLLYHFGVGAHGVAALDIVHLGAAAIVLELRPHMAWLFTGTLFGATALAGLRF